MDDSPRTGPDGSNPPGGIERRRLPPTLSWVALVLGIVLIAGFVLTARTIHHPLIISAGLVFLLFPWLHDPLVSRSIQTIIGLTILWFLLTIEDILTPLLVAAGLAYACSPLFFWLRGERGRWRPLRLNATAASLIVTVMLFGFLGMVGAQTGTLLIGQATEMSRIIDESVIRVQGIFPDTWQESPILKNFADGVVRTVGEFGEKLPALAGGVARGMGFALMGMLGSLMTLVFFFYILRDSRKLMRGLVRRYLPDSMHDFVDERSRRVLRTLTNFVEGFFITSSVVFVLTLILLLVARVRMAFLLALVAALLNIIPVIGFWVSTAIILVIALASDMPVGEALLVGACLGVINIFEGNILQPKIIGRKVGLHPVAAILSVAIFGEILGFFGYLLGIPLAAVLTKEWEDYLARGREKAGRSSPGARQADE